MPEPGASGSTRQHQALLIGNYTHPAWHYRMNCLFASACNSAWADRRRWDRRSQRSGWASLQWDVGGSQARRSPHPQGHAQGGNPTVMRRWLTFSTAMNSSDLLTSTTNVPFYHLQYDHLYITVCASAFFPKLRATCRSPFTVLIQIIFLIIWICFCNLCL